ncbi:MAG: DNA-protecting protein DprA [Proteobacteria bacterium]|nr:DNA-protecting protein DprA [Pseudomonadota bacterium]
MDRERLGHYLALQQIKGLGTNRLARLFHHFNTLDAILAASPAELESALGRSWPGLAAAIQAAPEEGVLERTLKWLRSEHHHLIAWEDPDYPPLLREIPDPPVLLYVSGNPAYLSRPGIAIVGSRNPTPAGVEHAMRFARGLADLGLVVTSGMALGVDAAAHSGALSARAPTVAVVGTGLDLVYPARHRKLATEIVTRGAMVSEFALGVGPRPDHFPRRNRIISGLSLGTIVVEAAPQSGSLITARLALEQGREVFAIPGSIDSPQSKGCHMLLKTGAKMVETLSDITEELGAIASFTLQTQAAEKAAPKVDIPAIYAPLLGAMGHEPASVDLLIERTGLTADVISSMLLQMELQQLVSQCSGGRYMRLTQVTGTNERKSV